MPSHVVDFTKDYAPEDFQRAKELGAEVRRRIELQAIDLLSSSTALPEMVCPEERERAAFRRRMDRVEELKARDYED